MQNNRNGKGIRKSHPERSEGSSAPVRSVDTTDRKKLKIAKTSVLYLFLILGGLWHLLGFFHQTMKILAGPVLIALSIWLFLEFFFANKDKNFRYKLVSYSIVLVSVSWYIEFIGVDTGMIFGEYVYGGVLLPALSSVPAAIGFAWLTTLFASTGVVPLFRKRFKPLIHALFTALLMTFFDFLMEPAATKLNYWNWAGGTVPLLNYISWFVFGFIFSYAGIRLNLFRGKIPAIAPHFYFAQVVYFLMIYLK